jgi:dimethylhistidine N-methyltransferase
VPPRWLYDDLGSALFEAICQLPWYRITRSEAALLDRHAEAVFDAIEGEPEIVELGGGNGAKLDRLLLAAAARRRTASVRLIDISAAALERAAARLSGRPGVSAVHTTHAPYEAALASLPATSAPRLVLFLGSNIGNFEPDEATAFLRRLCHAAGPSGAVLMGIDLVKPEPDLRLAYDDPLQVTAAFNRNLLARMNRELGATFPLDAFAHQAVWNAVDSRIEMRLVATRAIDVTVAAASVTSRFEAGEFIWTENSYKYAMTQVKTMATAAGLDLQREWIDPAAQFALTLLRPRV